MAFERSSSPRRFDPRSREGSDPMPVQSVDGKTVSIHAPAKGATPPSFSQRMASDSSFDPRSREGSDSVQEFARDREQQFRSTLPRRERHVFEASAPYEHVSIHAPAKGATTGGRRASDRTICRFRSTLPRRERPARPVGYDADACSFDPRSREGSDRPSGRHTRVGSEVSIHAPAKGATLGRMIDGLHVSIHAPAKGATACQLRRLACRGFDPRSREGSDPEPRRRRRSPCRFDPRSREGSDNARRSRSSADGFDPRSREGSDGGR